VCHAINGKRQRKESVASRCLPPRLLDSHLTLSSSTERCVLRHGILFWPPLHSFPPAGVVTPAPYPPHTTPPQETPNRFFPHLLSFWLRFRKWYLWRFPLRLSFLCTPYVDGFYSPGRFFAVSPDSCKSPQCHPLLSHLCLLGKPLSPSLRFPPFPPSIVIDPPAAFSV